MSKFRKFVSSKNATTTMEKVLLALGLIGIILGASALTYNVAVLEVRLRSIEEILQPPEQVLVIGTVNTVDNIDPAWGNTNWDHLVGHMVHEPLLTHDASSEVAFALATDYEFSDDYLTCTLYLREDVKFHNGMPFNASAVKYTYERSIAEAGIGRYFMGPINYDNPVDIVDDYTVRINLDEKIPAIYPQNLAIGFGGCIIFPGAVDEEDFKVGTGPYEISEFIRGERTVFERNDDYWGEQANLETIIIKEYTETTALRLALEAGEVDLAMNTRWKPSDIDALQGNPGIGWQTTPGGAGYHRFFYFDNTGTYPPLNNTLVRQAIAYAIDKERLLAVGLKGEGELSFSMCPSYLTPYYTASWEEYYPTDKTKAKQLLADAGYPDGFATEFWYTPDHFNVLDRDVALLIQDDLQQIGIEVTVRSDEWAAFKSRRFDPKMPMALVGWVPDYPDPDNLISAIIANFGFYGPIIGYNNSRLNELGRLGASEVDVEKRVEYYHEMQQIAADELPVLPIVEAVDWAFYRPNVKGFHLSALVSAWGSMFRHVYIE